MPCSCGDSNCLCFEKCLCPVKLCTCIMCMNITTDEVNNANPEDATPKCSLKVSKSFLIADNYKFSISSDVDARTKKCLQKFHGIDDKSENTRSEYSPNISKTLLNTDNSQTLVFSGLDAHTENLFEELNGIEDDAVIVCEEKPKSDSNCSSRHDDILQIIASPESDIEIESSIGKRFIPGSFKKKSDNAFDALLTHSTSFPRTIRTYSKNRKTEKELNPSKCGPSNMLPSLSTCDEQRESCNSDFPIPLTDDSSDVNVSRLGQPQLYRNMKNIRWVTYVDFSRNIRQSNRSTPVPYKKENEWTRKSSWSYARYFKSSTEVSTEPERQETINSKDYKHLNRIPRRGLRRAPQVLNRTSLADNETSLSSRLSVYDLDPAEFENDCKRDCKRRNRCMSSKRRGRDRPKPNQTANLTSLPEASGTGLSSNKSKRKYRRKKKRSLCKTKQGDLNGQRKEMKPIKITQEEPGIKTGRKFFQQGLKIERQGWFAKSILIKKEKL